MQIGLDATIFLRFIRMCRNIFVVLTIIGCGILIPTYLVDGGKVYKTFKNVSFFSKLTPLYTFGEPNWAQVAVAWLFDIVICGFLWWNYRAVLKLRREYFDSLEYQKSLHARTLMVRINCITLDMQLLISVRYMIFHGTSHRMKASAS